MKKYQEILTNEEGIKFRWKIILPNSIEGMNIEINNKCTNYMITKKGKIFNIKTGYELKPFINNNGYYSINIQLGHKNCYKTLSIHRLLGMSYIKNIENRPIINHIDGNKLNNDLNNLEWVTYSENNLHAFKSGLKKPTIIESEKCNLTRHSKDEVIKVCKLLEKGYTPKALHRLFNIDYDFAHCIFNRSTWKEISKDYNFIKTKKYSQFFKLKEIDKIDELFKLNFKYKEIAKYFNWEYNELLRGRLKMLKKTLDKYHRLNIKYL